MTLEFYKEIKFATKAIYKEKGSKFVSYATPIYSNLEFKEKLQEIRGLEHAARHHCYAYVLHSDKSDRRTNDDGEPSSSAGKPILGQILSNDLTNTLVVVARYFGGTKLGIPGLIQAYKTAAASSISKSEIITKKIKEEYEISFKYEQTNNIMRVIKEYNLEIIFSEFNIKCKIIFAVNKNKVETVLNTLQKNYKLNVKHIKSL